MSRTNSAATAGRLRRPAAFALQLLCAVVLLLASAVVGAHPAQKASADPGDLQSQEWWIDRLGLNEVWKISKGAGVTVAVLDSGVQASVGDLHGAVVSGFDSAGSADARTDPDGHGTSMAVEIAGRGTSPGLLGVAPQAKILPVVVPTHGENEATIVALDKLSAMPRPPQVVNMSYGAPGACPDDLQAAVKKAVDNGMILVSSAGNDGSSTNQSQAPANCAGVIAVGAIDTDGNAWEDTERQSYVTLAGPGVNIVGYNAKTLATEHYDGTSDAAAIVSGSIAVVRAHFPHMPSRQLVARFIATAYQFDGAQHKHNDRLGWGAARPHHALTDKVPSNAPNPVYDALKKVAGSTPPTRPTSPGGGASTAPSSAADAGGSSSGSSSSTGVIIAVVVGAVLVMIIVAGLVRLRSRRNRMSPR